MAYSAFSDGGGAALVSVSTPVGVTIVSNSVTACENSCLTQNPEWPQMGG